MDPISTDDLQDFIEAYLDQQPTEVGMSNVIDALAEVAYKKASHIETVWQDLALAGHWRSAGDFLQKVCAEKVIAI